MGCCGGTALARARRIVRRMSEDVDRGRSCSSRHSPTNGYPVIRIALLLTPGGCARIRLEVAPPAPALLVPDAWFCQRSRH